MSGSTSSCVYGYPLEVGEWATRQNDRLRFIDSLERLHTVPTCFIGEALLP
jgi:hypothetical protein